MPGATGDPGAGASGAEHPGVMTRGIGSPETYYFRRLYTDAVRALETAAEHPLVDAERIAVNGFSQGGGLSLAAAALAPGLVRLCMADMPYLCDIERGAQIAPERALHRAHALSRPAPRAPRRDHRHAAARRLRAARLAHPRPLRRERGADGPDLPALDGLRRLQRDHRAQGAVRLPVRHARAAVDAPRALPRRVRWPSSPEPFDRIREPGPGQARQRATDLEEARVPLVPHPFPCPRGARRRSRLRARVLAARRLRLGHGLRGRGGCTGRRARERPEDAHVHGRGRRRAAAGHRACERLRARSGRHQRRGAGCRDDQDERRPGGPEVAQLRQDRRGRPRDPGRQHRARLGERGALRQRPVARRDASTSPPARAP